MMKKYIPYVIIVLYLFSFFLPFALGADPYSLGTVTVTGIDFAIANLQAFGLLIILLVAYFLFTNNRKTSPIILIVIGIILLYIYGSPFYASPLGSMTYLIYVKTLLMNGLKYGFYFSAFVAFVGYAMLWKNYRTKLRDHL